MPEAIRTHKPRLHLPQQHGTLKSRQGERTLALNGATWRKLRAVVLSRDPLCPRCRLDGHIEHAVEVDHIDSDPSNNTLANLVGLCKLHHGQKTRQVQREKSPGTDTPRTVR